MYWSPCWYNCQACQNICPYNVCMCMCVYVKCVCVCNNSCFLCRDSGFSFTRLDGSMSSAARTKAVRELQDPSPGSPTVMLLSLKAGGVGLNLTGASRVFVMEPVSNSVIYSVIHNSNYRRHNSKHSHLQQNVGVYPDLFKDTHMHTPPFSFKCCSVSQAWNPAVEDQCVDRCHRLGQTRDVIITKVRVCLRCLKMVRCSEVLHLEICCLIGVLALNYWASDPPVGDFLSV